MRQNLTKKTRQNNINQSINFKRNRHLIYQIKEYKICNKNTDPINSIRTEAMNFYPKYIMKENR